MSYEPIATPTGAAGIAMETMAAWRNADSRQLRNIRQRLADQSAGCFDEECLELLEAVTEKMCLALDTPGSAPANPSVWMELLAHAAQWQSTALTPRQEFEAGRRAILPNAPRVQLTVECH